MRLAVVTVNYCCADAILRALESTAAQIGETDGEWWIVDNDSPDNSTKILRQAISKLSNVRLVQAPKNGGFGYGNNRIINKALTREINPEYMYFLNPDAIPEPGAVRAMVEYLDEQPAVALVGSGLLNQDGSHTDSMFRFPSFWSEVETALSFGPVSRLLRFRRQSLPLDHAGPVDWVGGTSFMVRTEVLRNVGGFDEDFFLYWEEVELCYRIKQAGYSVHGLPKAKVRHLGGVSTGMHEPHRRVPRYWHQSRNLYFRKTGGGGPLPILNLVVALGLVFRRILQLVRRLGQTPPHFLGDHVRYSLKDAVRPYKGH